MGKTKELMFDISECVDTDVIQIMLNEYYSNLSDDDIKYIEENENKS
jgi:hypothetical protein